MNKTILYYVRTKLIPGRVAFLKFSNASCFAKENNSIVENKSGNLILDERYYDVYPDYNTLKWDSTNDTRKRQ